MKSKQFMQKICLGTMFLIFASLVVTPALFGDESSIDAVVIEDTIATESLFSADNMVSVSNDFGNTLYLTDFNLDVNYHGAIAITNLEGQDSNIEIVGYDESDEEIFSIHLLISADNSEEIDLATLPFDTASIKIESETLITASMETQDGEVAEIMAVNGSRHFSQFSETTIAFPASPRTARSSNYETAWTFQFPTVGYSGGSYGNRDFLSPSNHLGEDSVHTHKTMVRAIEFKKKFFQNNFDLLNRFLYGTLNLTFNQKEVQDGNCPFNPGKFNPLQTGKNAETG